MPKKNFSWVMLEFRLLLCGVHPRRCGGNRHLVTIPSGGNHVPWGGAGRGGGGEREIEFRKETSTKGASCKRNGGSQACSQTCGERIHFYDSY